MNSRAAQAQRSMPQFIMEVITKLKQAKRAIRDFSGSPEDFLLPVSDQLQDFMEINMAIIREAIFARGWESTGFEQREGFRVYRYRTCRFCEVVNANEPAHIIWEDAHFLALLKVPPDNPGHSVVIPKLHVVSVFSLREPLYSSFFQAAKSLYTPLKQAVGAGDVAVNLRTVGCGHVHINLIPTNDGDLNYLHEPIEMNDTQLAQVAEDIRISIVANSKGGNRTSA